MDIGKPKRVWKIDPKREPDKDPLQVPDDWPGKVKPGRRKEKKAHNR